MAVDLTSPKPPPAKPRQSAAATARENVASRRASGVRAEREEGINGLFQLAGGALMMLKQPADAAACAKHGPNIAPEVAALAETNEGVGKLLDYLTAVGPYAGLITAVMPFALQILANHGRVPVSAVAQFGIVTPETLEAELMRDVLRQQADMMREANAAEQEMQQAQSEIAAMVNAQAAAPSPNGVQPEPVPA